MCKDPGLIDEITRIANALERLVKLAEKMISEDDEEKRSGIQGFAPPS